MTRAHYDEADRLDPKYIQPIVDLLGKYGKASPFPAAEMVWPVH